MNQVLDMIDTIAKVSPNTIITERGEALAFLAMLYEEQGKWKQALEYQHKVSENNEMRYSLEKRRVLQEVQTQYEVEKQQLEMERLETSNRLIQFVQNHLVLCAFHHLHHVPPWHILLQG